MNARLDDGSTAREHAMAVWEQHGVKPDVLKDAPPLPYCARHLWAIYAALHRRRGHSEAGPNPLSFGDVADYERQTRTRLDRWEADAILAIDDEYLAASSEARKTKGT